MLSLLVVSVALAAAPFKAASAGITVSGLPAERAEFYSEFVAQQMTVSGVNVVTPRQVQSLLGMERQRQMLGCASESASCLAEIASALGVDGIVQGEAAKLDSGFQVSLKVLWSRDGRALTVFTGRSSDEGGLLDMMSTGARLMARDLSDGDWVRLTVTPAQHFLTPSSPLLPSGVALLGVAVAGAVIGSVGLWRSGAIASELQNPSKQYVSRAEAQAVANDGKSMQTLALVGYSVAGVALVAGGVLTFMGLPRSPLGSVRPVAGFSPNGGVFGLAGELP